jgi:integrase
VHYDLYVKDTTVNYAGKQKRAIAVNGQIPMPALKFTKAIRLKLWYISIERKHLADFFVLINDVKHTEPRTYRSYYKKFMQALDMPQLKFHGLRHFFATRCIESKCDYKTVSVILGRSNVSTTLNLYVHPNVEQKKKCIDQMFKALK